MQLKVVLLVLPMLYPHAVRTHSLTLLAATAVAFVWAILTNSYGLLVSAIVPFIGLRIFAGKLQTKNEKNMIDIQLIQESLPLLLRGALVTLQIAALGALIGIIGGTLLGVAQTAKSRLARWFSTFYVTIIRGTPMLIQITLHFMYCRNLASLCPHFG